MTQETNGMMETESALHFESKTVTTPDKHSQRNTTIPQVETNNNDVSSVVVNQVWEMKMDQ